MVMTLMSNPKGSVATIIVSQAGDGDTTDIQTGINLLPATGGVVYVKEGTYTTTVPISLNLANVALIGAGRSTIISTTENITIIQMLAADAANGCIVDKVLIRGTDDVTQIGVLTETDQCVVSNCWIEDVNIGIRVAGGDDDIILSNHISSSGDAGIQFAGGGVDLRGIISSNVIDNCDVGISIIRYAYCIINGNLVRDNSINGIETGSNCTFNVFSNNICVDNGGDGIQIQLGGDNQTMNSNVCTGNGGYGIAISNVGNEDNIILGNMLSGNTTGPINDVGTNTQLAHNMTT